MFNAINSKLLLAIALGVAAIASSLAWRNTHDPQAQALAEHQRFVQEVQQIQKTQDNNWGGSAHTLRHYRSK